MGKATLVCVIWFGFVAFGMAKCVPDNYLSLLYLANYLPEDPTPQYHVPDGPTYGCWPTGASCGLDCDNWSWWCVIYCTVLTEPTGYYCVEGCQYLCVYQSGTFFFECRDIIPIGCLCDIQPRECPEAG